MVWITMIGRQASSTCMLVAGSNAKPVARPVASIAAPIPGSERSHSRGTPELILSTVARVTSSTLGSRLKCISGTHAPASAESSRRLRSSAR